MEYNGEINFEANCRFLLAHFCMADVIIAVLRWVNEDYLIKQRVGPCFSGFPEAECGSFILNR